MDASDAVEKHEDTIYVGAMAAAAVGVPGAVMAGGDLLLLAPIWVTMILKISADADRSFDSDTIKKFCASLVKAGGAWIVGSKALTALLNLIPGFGTLGAVSVNTLLNFIYTLRLGSLTAESMEEAEFNVDDVTSIASVIFAPPSRKELSDAWRYYRSHI